MEREREEVIIHCFCRALTGLGQLPPLVGLYKHIAEEFYTQRKRVEREGGREGGREILCKVGGGH